MFVGGGSVDGVRLLRPETLAMMTANQLTERLRAAAEMLGMPAFGAHGFGLGVAVVLDPEKAACTLCRGGIGTVGWPGAFGRWWQADPTDGSMMIFLAHNNVGPDELANGLGLGLCAAIERFHALSPCRTSPSSRPRRPSRCPRPEANARWPVTSRRWPSASSTPTSSGARAPSRQGRPPSRSAAAVIWSRSFVTGRGFEHHAGSGGVLPVLADQLEGDAAALVVHLLHLDDAEVEAAVGVGAAR